MRRNEDVGTHLQTMYVGLNDCHASDCAKLTVSRSAAARSTASVTRSACPPSTARRPDGQHPAHPRTQMGALVQLDASSLPWLSDGGPSLALHGAIDDATGGTCPRPASPPRSRMATSACSSRCALGRGRPCWPGLDTPSHSSPLLAVQGNHGMQGSVDCRTMGSFIRSRFRADGPRRQP
jgi:hypothetical protein